jgi:hypothetical protein
MSGARLTTSESNAFCISLTGFLAGGVSEFGMNEMVNTPTASDAPRSSLAVAL